MTDAATVLASRPARTVFTSLGTAVAACALVTTVGLSSTAAAQINSAFDAYLATEVTATPVDDDAVTLIDGRTASAVSRIHGVEDSGRLAEVSLPDTASLSGATGARYQTQVYAADDGALAVIAPFYSAGRAFATLPVGAADYVLLSRPAAEALGIQSLALAPVVFLDEHPLTVVGIYDQVRREPDTMLGAVLPYRSAARMFGARALSGVRLVVSTRPGAAAVVAEQLAVAAAPQRPDALAVSRPQDPNALVGQIDQVSTGLVALLVAFTLLAGGIGIAASLAVAVAERRAEIGLRRAVGATPADIATQFVAEGTILGGVGSTVGISAALVLIAATCWAKGWVAVISPSLPVLALGLGLGVGTLGAAYPAWRATRVSPLDALRRR